MPDLRTLAHIAQKLRKKSSKDRGQMGQATMEAETVVVIVGIGTTQIILGCS